MGKRIIWTILLVLVCIPLCAGDEKTVRPEPSSLAETGPRPKAVPTPPPEDIDAAIDRGIQFLLKRQNRNGSWGSAETLRLDEVYAPVPGAHQGFRAAVTSLCICALIDSGGDRPEVTQALDRAEIWLFEHLPGPV